MGESQTVPELKAALEAMSAECGFDLDTPIDLPPGPLPWLIELSAADPETLEPQGERRIHIVYRCEPLQAATGFCRTAVGR